MFSTAALLALVGFVASSVHALPAVKRDSGTKAVFAHHILGFTNQYTSADWQQDITLAHAAGIDGFALNVGSDSWQPGQVATAYQVAQASGTGFKLFISLDMAAMQQSCNTADGATLVRNYVTTYANHPNQYKYNGRVLLSTFSGDQCTFGQSGSPQSAWQSQVFNQLTGANAVYFVPSFFIPSNTFSQWSNIANGMFNWNSGWTLQLNTGSVNQILSSQGESLSATSPQDIEKITQILLPQVGSIGSDQDYVNGLQSMTSNDGAPTYMGAVTPWFFTHYGDPIDKNWIYYSDSHLYNTRWEQVIANRNLFDMIEIISWNDFSESHYIGPNHGDPPAGTTWLNGFDHSAWLNMTSYYIAAYKTGQYPAINQDRIYIWARPHPKEANANNDPIGKPTDYAMTQDIMWAVVFNTAPSTVNLWTSDSNTQSFNLPAGVSKINMPLTETGGYMRAQIVRNGQVITDFAPPGYFYQPAPNTYNYNAFTAGWEGPVTGGGNPPPPPPPSGQPIHPNGNTAKCLDVQAGVFANGTPVQIYDCNGTGSQNWVLNKGSTAVQVAGTNFCLDAGTTPTNGTQMKIWTCFSNLPAQEWSYTNDNRIALTNQGFCLDDPSGNLNDGTIAQIWKCTDNDVWQIWTTS